MPPSGRLEEAECRSRYCADIRGKVSGAREAVEGVVGVGDCFAARDVGLAGDFAVVAGAREVVLDVDAVRLQLLHLADGVVGAGFAGGAADAGHGEEFAHGVVGGSADDVGARGEVLEFVELAFGVKLIAEIGTRVPGGGGGVPGARVLDGGVAAFGVVGVGGGSLNAGACTRRASKL